jgi:hypothetical protein
MHEGVEPRYRYEMLKRLCCLVALSVLFGSAAGADSIYLKNGRVIHCDWTREEGQYLVFGQYGGEAKIPLHAVERVEEDSETEPAPAPTTSQEEYRAALVRRYAEAGLSSPVQGPVRQPLEGAIDPAPQASTDQRPSGSVNWRNLSPDTREYWQLRVAEIEEQMDEVEAEIARLPEYNDVEEKILDGRILWVVQEKERLGAVLLDLHADLMTVKEDARKSGIPPGWLRTR